MAVDLEGGPRRECEDALGLAPGAVAGPGVAAGRGARHGSGESWAVKAVIQRVARAAVRVGGTSVGEIGKGLVVLLGVLRTDRVEDADRLADRTVRLRIFNDEADRMNLSLLDVGGEALVVSQFTLAGSTRRGLRPSFDAAAPPEAAEALYDRYVAALARMGPRVATGRFRAMMEVELVGDGPVTFVLEEPRGPGRAGRKDTDPEEEGEET